MAGFLRVTAIGNLGRDPEKRYSSEGKPALRFSVAATKRIRNRDGEWEDETDWLSCTLFGARAESLAALLEKGTRVYVEGRLHKRDYETTAGAKGSSLDVIVSEIQILTAKPRSDGYEQDRLADDAEDLGPARARPAATGRAALDPSGDRDLEDLPF